MIEVLNSISILIAVWVAIYGIDSWRREHSGKRRLELAEDALSMFYEAADAIRHIRHPASFGSETASIEQGKHESDSDFQARKNASIVFLRYQEHSDLFNKLHAMRYRFMAQIGKAEARSFDDLREINNTIQGSAHVLSRLWSRDNFVSEPQRISHRADLAKHEAIFWEGLEEDDPINPRLQQVIETFESVCRGIIAGDGTLFAVINKKLGVGS